MGVQLSIVVPAYNARPYIVECIESVLAQDAAPDFEVIVVDDGSSDRTADLVRERFTSIRVIQKQNGGPGSARNVGVAAAKSSVVIFIDADDIMLPGRLASQGVYMLKHPEIGLSFGNQQYENKPDFNSNATHALAIRSEFELFADLHRRLITGPNYVPNTAVAVSRKAYIATGGQPEDIIMQEDFAMHCAIARAWPIATSLRFLTWYRQSHSEHITADRTNFYHCFVTARGRELRASRNILSSTDLDLGLELWRSTAEKMLAKIWIEQGRDAVLAELAKWDDLFSPGIARKWRSMSRIPPVIGFAAREVVRHIRSAAQR